METTLKRSKFTARPELILENRDVFERAKEILSYRPTALSQESIRNQRRKEELIVEKALESLGIEPLDGKSVATYQSARVVGVERQGSSKFVKYMHTRKGEPVVVLLGIFAFAVAVMIGIFAATLFDEKRNILPHVNIYWNAARLDVLLFTSWIFCLVARHKRAISFTARWDRENINSYNARVPEFALTRALEIKEALPEAWFAVETLHEERHGIQTEFNPRPPDPFMVLRYGEVTLYLDVWNEPSFEGRRTV